MRKSAGLAFNSIIRCRTLVTCQAHDVEFKSFGMYLWRQSITGMHLALSTMDYHDKFPC